MLLNYVTKPTSKEHRVIVCVRYSIITKEIAIDYVIEKLMR